MSLTVVIGSQAGPALAIGGALVPRDTLHALVHAQDITAQAEAHARMRTAKAAEEAHTVRAQAHAEGLAQGRAEAMGRLLGAWAAEARLRQLLEDRLADVLERSLRSLIGPPGDAEGLRLRALHLLRAGGIEGGKPGAACLVVHPADALAIDAMAASLGVSVRPDAQRPSGQLLLEMPDGFVVSDIEATVDGMLAMLSQGLAQLHAWEGGAP